VPVIEVANIYFSSSASSTTHFPIAPLPSYIDMDIDCDIIKERPASI